MLSRIMFVLAVTSLAALALRFFGSVDEASLEREAAGNLDALRDHLFKR
jgi:hypothetical protein